LNQNQRNFRAKTQSSQRKAEPSVLKPRPRDFRISFASLAALRETLLIFGFALSGQWHCLAKFDF
jgi:hypothetical protein